MADNLEQYKTIEELKEFAEAQQKVLVQLNKKVQKLEQERNHLKELLEKSVPILPLGQLTGESSQKFSSSDEESIARQQLYILKQVSSQRELTLEECRKTETYTKILQSIKSTIKPQEREVEKLSDEELLKLYQGGGNK